MYTQLRPYPNTFTATKAWFNRLAKRFCQVNEYALTAILVRKSEEVAGKYEVLLTYQKDPDIR